MPKVQGSTAGPRGSYASRRLGLAEQYLRSPALEHVERLSELLLGDTDRLGRVFAPGKAPRRRLEMQGNGGKGSSYVSEKGVHAFFVTSAVALNGLLRGERHAVCSRIGTSILRSFGGARMQAEYYGSVSRWESVTSPRRTGSVMD